MGRKPSKNPSQKAIYKRQWSAKRSAVKKAADNEKERLRKAKQAKKRTAEETKAFHQHQHAVKMAAPKEQKERNKKRMRERRVERVGERTVALHEKLLPIYNKGCATSGCPIKLHAAMHMDHIKAEDKEFGMATHDAINADDETQDKEISKLQGLCVPCHRAKTILERKKSKPTSVQRDMMREWKIAEGQCSSTVHQLLFPHILPLTSMSTDIQLAAYDIDHRKRDSKQGTIVRMPVSELLEFMTNHCQLLCACCHMLKTLMENKKIHGKGPLIDLLLKDVPKEAFDWFEANTSDVDWVKEAAEWKRKVVDGAAKGRLAKAQKTKEKKEEETKEQPDEADEDDLIEEESNRQVWISLLDDDE